MTNSVLEDEDVQDELHQAWLMIAVKMISQEPLFDDDFIDKTTGLGMEKIRELREKVKLFRRKNV